MFTFIFPKVLSVENRATQLLNSCTSKGWSSSQLAGNNSNVVTTALTVVFD